MENDGKTQVIYCNNLDVHKGTDENEGQGNILMFLRNNFIFVKCSNHHCKRWIRVKIDVPGIAIDFSNTAFTIKKMPKKYHFVASKAPVVIEE